MQQHTTESRRDDVARPIPSGPPELCAAQFMEEIKQAVAEVTSEVRSSGSGSALENTMALTDRSYLEALGQATGQARLKAMKTAGNPLFVMASTPDGMAVDINFVKALQYTGTAIGCAAVAYAVGTLVYIGGKWVASKVGV